MVAADALHGESAAAATDEVFSSHTCVADLQTFFDHVELEVKASGCGGEDVEEELEWLSNKDAFPTVETMDWAGAQPRTKGVRQPRRVVAWSAAEGRKCWHCGTEATPQWRDGPKGPHTLCNACGLRYRSGRLLPEYRPASSPTFSSELHSNRHSRVVKLRRQKGGAIETSPGAGGYGEERGEERELLLNKTTLLAVETIAPAGQRPRTKGLQRPRRALSWSPPPRPRTPAAVGGRRRSGRGGAGVATQQGRVPGSGDNFAGRGADAEEGCAAGGGVEAAAPRVLAATEWRQCQAGDGMVVEQARVASCGKDGPTFPMRHHRIVQLLRAEVPTTKASPTIAAGEGRAVGVGGGVEPPAPPAPAALAQRRCQHCRTVKTPQWREGPGGRRTLCNACGVRYKSGRLLPEYRPASSPTFCMELHSNLHHRVVQLRRLRASPVIAASDRWRVE